MKLAVVNLTGGGFSGGYLKILDSLVPRLLEEKEVEKIDLFVPPQAAGAKIGGLSHPRTWPEGDSRWGFPALKRSLKEIGPDVVFIPTARWLDCGGTPVVVMVQNMEPLRIPFGGNSWSESLRNLARARAARVACNRATRVIGVSDHVRDFLVNRWGIQPGKVGRVYMGADRPPESGASKRPEAVAEGQPFLFTAGSIRPARGLEDAIGGLATLGGEQGGLHLVIGSSVDRRAEHYGEKLRSMAKRLGVSDRIIWTGFMDGIEMSWCYRNCKAFVMTSRAEACPNIALEAMSNGCLIVSTSQEPMPEFFKGCATYYAPANPEELGAAVATVLALGEAEREKLRSAGIGRAAQFDWGESVRGVLRELRLAAGTLGR